MTQQRTEPADDTERLVFSEPEGDLPEHYAAIGRLIMGFSKIEHAINRVLRTMLNLPSEAARAITGEMRAGDLMSALTRVLDARDRDKIISEAAKAGRRMGPEELKDALTKESLKKNTNPTRENMDHLFDEIRRLKSVRDHIAHRRFYVCQRQMAFTNSETARSLIQEEYDLYSIDELNDFARYAAHLTSRANLILNPEAVKHAVAQGVPFLEIPPRLQKERNRRGRDKAGQGRQRQQRSSPS
jgi:hypothetical protein